MRLLFIYEVTPQISANALNQRAIICQSFEMEDGSYCLKRNNIIGFNTLRNIPIPTEINLQLGMYILKNNSTPIGNRTRHLHPGHGSLTIELYN